MQHTSRGKMSASAERAAERRQRDDEAPRLKTMVPLLLSLRIDIEDRGAIGTVKHVRHVMVDRASTIFVIPCGDKSCNSEGHDITTQVMRALNQRREAFDGEHTCEGSVGSANCTRVISYRAQAKYNTV